MAQPDADRLAGLARELGGEIDVDAVWGRVVQASLSQVDGAEHAGITLLSGRSVSTPVATSELVRRVDRHQYTTGEGPCLSAATDHQPVVRVDDLDTDRRWPEFADAAVELGGVLDAVLPALHRRRDDRRTEHVRHHSGAFTDDSVHTGTLLAAHAAVAAAATPKSASLRIALDSRDVIGQAKGILMERYKLSAQQAFDLLVIASQRTHRKLRDVAADLAATGDLGVD